MTVIDPALDKDPDGGRSDGRDLAMFRHDIRAALQGVVGGLALIDPAAVDAATGALLERIDASARTLQALVGGMFGEGPRDGPVPAAMPCCVDVADLLRYVERRHGGEARARGLGLEIAAADGAPEALRVDPLSMTRIVDNLVGNAVKFSDAGTVGLTIGRGAGGVVILTVSDEGPGLGADMPGRESTASRRGEGLGLQIVRSLTARLGGELGLANRSWGGLQATIRLPAEIAAARSRHALEPLPDLGGLHVLLAEDNPTNQMVASQMLRALNARVTVCSDGVEALERFDAEPVDLVVVDIEMPRLSGLDVIRTIRARTDARAQVPIVALTAYAMREHRERIAAAGANELIPKPITSVEALGRGLAAHLARPAPARPPAPAPVPGSDADGPVIELATFDALCAAIGADTMGELLDKVVADLAAAQRELANARAPLDLGPIRSASHILISVAGAIGAVRLEACARTLNAVAHAPAAEPVAAGVDRCIAEIDAALAFARERGAAR